ncbi:hypothetical protein CEP52_008189 [Fusarium oligoseptatum]|uniref:Uncharacterized protein n=1 Tax=Fusarium oligoseptatum TaxID=2604345 RepID=A0A428TJ89_9HYPO|nr:hypothetical protein CEP52_008189 [Fusarium oligoseptatum]
MEKTVVRKDGRVWSDSSRLQLLAYLNWCVTYRGNLLPTAGDHLRRVTGNSFTEMQIRQKLRREWQNHGLCDNFNEVFTQGTPSLNLSDQEQMEIQSIFSGLRHGPHELRSNTRETQTRSRAALNALRTLRAKSPAIRLKSDQQEFSGTSPQLLDYNASGEGDGYSAVNLIQVPTTESELSSPCPSFLSVPQSRSPTSSPGPSEQPLADIAALQDEVLKLKGHNLTLQNRVSVLETDHAEIRHLRESEKGDDIKYCTRMIHILEKRNKARSTHSRNVKDFQAGSRGLPESTIMQEYTALYSSIINESQAFCADDESPRIRNNNEDAHPARSWAMTATGWDLYPLLCYYNTEAIPSSRLVAALVGAGIFDLVFERAFPDVLGVESPLMDGYRRHILVKDGPEALHMADLAALDSFTQRDVDGKARLKKQMIEEKAEHLSKFMLQSLSFCITAQNRQATTPDDDSHMEDVPTDDDPDIEEAPTHDDLGTEDVSPDLKDPLRKALNLKFSLTTSMTRLKFYFFLPGHCFDETSMEKDDMSSDGGSVKLCLLPALFSVPRSRLDTRIEESRWEVETHYDRCLTEAREEEVASLRLVAKAVVLT